MEIKETFKVSGTRHHKADGSTPERVVVTLEQAVRAPGSMFAIAYGPYQDITVEIRDRSKFDQLLPGEEFEVTLRSKRTL